MWDRAKAEDSKRVNAITTEKQRIEVDKPGWLMMMMMMIMMIEVGSRNS